MNSENNKSALRIGLIAVLAIALIVGAVLIFKDKGPKPDKTIGGQGFERVSYDLFASSTPTSVYTGNTKVLNAGYLENLHLDFRYTPASQDSVLYILVEGSNDDGATYFPMSAKSIGTTDMKIYVEGVSSTTGIPLTIPGDSTTASGTMYAGMVDFDLVADHVKFSLKESTTSTYGEVYLRGTLTTKK